MRLQQMARASYYGFRDECSIECCDTFVENYLGYPSILSLGSFIGLKRKRVRKKKVIQFYPLIKIHKKG